MPMQQNEPDPKDVARIQANVAKMRGANPPATEEEVLAYLQHEDSQVSAAPTPTKPVPRQAQAFFDHLGNQVLFGAGKYPAAAIQMLTKGGSYGDNLSQIKDDLAAEEKAYSGTSLAGNLAGAVVSPLNEIAAPLRAARNAPLLAKAAGYGKQGALLGALAGAGNTDGGVAERLKGAGVGAATGGILGTIGGFGGPGVGAALGGSAAAMLTPGSTKTKIEAGLLGAGVGAMAGAKVGSMLRAKPTTADLLLPALDAAQTTAAEVKADAPHMLADALPDLTRTVRGTSSEARALIDPALAARRHAQLPTITNALEEGLGAERGSVTQSVEDIIAKRAADATPAYQKAYAGPNITDPEVLKTMGLSRFRQAYKVAQRIARTEGDPLPDIGSGEEAAVPAILSDKNGVVSPEVAARYRASMAAQGITAPEAGISVRGLDLVKRGMDDVIDRGMRSGNMGRAEARALRNRLKDMLTTADAASPDYASARAEYAGHSNLKDAAEAGREFLSKDAAEVTKELGALSPSEAELYRRGAMDQLLTKLEDAQGSATGRRDLVNRFYSSVGGRARVEALFPSKKAYETFHTAMERLATQNETNNFVMAGSQTADKAAAQAAFAGQAGVSSFARAMRHPHATAAEIMQRIARSSAQARAGQIAPALIAQGAEKQSLLDALVQADAARANPRRGLLAPVLTRRAITGGIAGLLGTP